MQFNVRSLLGFVAIASVVVWASFGSVVDVPSASTAQNNLLKGIAAIFVVGVISAFIHQKSFLSATCYSVVAGFFLFWHAWITGPAMSFDESEFDTVFFQSIIWILTVLPASLILGLVAACVAVAFKDIPPSSHDSHETPMS